MKLRPWKFRHRRGPSFAGWPIRPSSLREHFPGARRRRPRRPPSFPKATGRQRPGLLCQPAEVHLLHDLRQPVCPYSRRSATRTARPDRGRQMHGCASCAAECPPARDQLPSLTRLVGCKSDSWMAPAYTSAGADAAAHALAASIWPLPSLLQNGAEYGADGDAGHAGDALLLADIRDLALTFQLLFWKGRVAARAAAARAWEMFSSMNLGEWASPQRKTPSVANPPRSLHVGFHIKSVGVQRHLEHVGKRAVFLQVRFQCRCSGLHGQPQIWSGSGKSGLFRLTTRP